MGRYRRNKTKQERVPMSLVNLAEEGRRRIKKNYGITITKTSMYDFIGEVASEPVLTGEFIERRKKKTDW